ncbi:hypothetical protein [Bradyrhizobium liaoningense]
MARLIYVPVVHSIAEMGSVAPAYQAAFIARYGERKWTERTSEFGVIWRLIAEMLDGLKLDPHRVRLYQDSLPVCGHEARIVGDLAAKGSPNHQILENLMKAGATLVGTESPALLLDEYALLHSPDRTEAKAAALLEARDRFIAKQIDETLGEDETGILFMGALHKVSRFLPPRIKVEVIAPKSR